MSAELERRLAALEARLSDEAVPALYKIGAGGQTEGGAGGGLTQAEVEALTNLLQGNAVLEDGEVVVPFLRVTGLDIQAITLATLEVLDEFILRELSEPPPPPLPIQIVIANVGGQLIAYDSAGELGGFVYLAGAQMVGGEKTFTHTLRAAASALISKGLGLWGHAAPAAQPKAIAVPAAPAAYVNGANGFKTEAEAKAIREKLAEVITAVGKINEALKGVGLTE